MIRAPFYFYFVLCVLFFEVTCQEYDFAAEISRQCLVPDPVGLLDCVENKVTLPYLTSWVDCTNSLGQNVRTSADIINYRCKSVWEGKGVIPEVFYIKDCVIEKTGLPAKNVSAEVLGAYKECESTPSVPQQGIKTAPVQQQQLKVSSVEYKPPSQQTQIPVFQPPQQIIQRQIQAPTVQPPQSQFQRAVQQIQVPLPRSQQPFQMQIPFQQTQPFQQAQIPYQQIQTPAPFHISNIASRQQFGSLDPKPFQIPRVQQQPFQQQISVTVPNQVPITAVQQSHSRPGQFNQQLTTATAFRPQYPLTVPKPQYPSPTGSNVQHQPYSQQFFTLYPQASSPNQQQNVNRAVLSQKTASNQPFVSQQLVAASSQDSSAILNAPYSYSFQIHHPLQITN